MIRRIKLKNEDGTPRPTSDIAADYMAAKCGAAEQASHPSITHCDNCGLDWLDNGLNPIGCPYCEHAALVAENEQLKADLARATETWKDDDSVVWRPPTAWAYAQVCRVMHESKAKHAALVARLGELEKGYRHAAINTASRSKRSHYGYFADDLARVVKEGGNG